MKHPEVIQINTCEYDRKKCLSFDSINATFSVSTLDGAIRSPWLQGGANCHGKVILAPAIGSCFWASSALKAFVLNSETCHIDAIRKWGVQDPSKRKSINQVSPFVRVRSWDWLLSNFFGPESTLRYLEVSWREKPRPIFESISNIVLSWLSLSRTFDKSEILYTRRTDIRV